VIAIIGILAAVVLASLNDARSGGKDASAKGSMTSIRNQAELYYNNNSYAYDADNTDNDNGVCGDSDIANLITAVDANDAGTPVCNESDTAYAAGTTLNAGFFCVDSTGYAGDTGAVLANGDVTCN